MELQNVARAKLDKEMEDTPSSAEEAEEMPFVNVLAFNLYIKEVVRNLLNRSMTRKIPSLVYVTNYASYPNEPTRQQITRSNPNDHTTYTAKRAYNRSD